MSTQTFEDIILLRSTDTGAPTISGTASLIAMLDACLKDGYNSKSVASVARSGTVATFTFATAHGYAADGLTKVTSSGWNEAAFNGLFQISNVTTLTFDVTVPNAGATAGTGAGVTKVAHLNWSKPFTGTNKGAYRSQDATVSQLYLKVDDNNPTASSFKSATWRGYETMTDIDTGTGLFPTVAQKTNGLFVIKSTAATSAVRPWVVIGSGQEFFLGIAFDISYPETFQFYYFGAPASEQPSDAYGCLIIADSSESFTSGGGTYFYQVSNPSVAQGHYMARSYTQVGTALGVGKLHHPLCTNIIGRGSVPYPAPNNNALYVTPIVISEGVLPRATLKGLYNPLHTLPLGFGVLVPSNVSPIGRRLWSATIAYSASTFSEGHFDLDGPWR